MPRRGREGSPLAPAEAPWPSGPQSWERITSGLITSTPRAEVLCYGSPREGLHRNLRFLPFVHIVSDLEVCPLFLQAGGSLRARTVSPISSGCKGIGCTSLLRPACSSLGSHPLAPCLVLSTKCRLCGGLPGPAASSVWIGMGPPHRPVQGDSPTTRGTAQAPLVPSSQVAGGGSGKGIHSKPA